MPSKFGAKEKTVDISSIHNALKRKRTEEDEEVQGALAMVNKGKAFLQGGHGDGDSDPDDDSAAARGARTKGTKSGDQSEEKEQDGKGKGEAGSDDSDSEFEDADEAAAAFADQPKARTYTGADNPHKLPISHSITLKGHSKAVSALALEPAGGRLISGSFDYLVQILFYFSFEVNLFFFLFYFLLSLFLSLCFNDWALLFSSDYVIISGQILGLWWYDGPVEIFSSNRTSGGAPCTNVLFFLLSLSPFPAIIVCPFDDFASVFFFSSLYCVSIQTQVVALQFSLSGDMFLCCTGHAQPKIYNREGRRKKDVLIMCCFSCCITFQTNK
jgi:hypothetical protein